MKLSKDKVQNITIVTLSCLLVLGFAFPPQSTSMVDSTFHFMVWVSVKHNGQWTMLVNGKHNTVTNIGLNWIRTELGDSGSSSTNVAKYISLTEDASTPLATWTILPSEIATGGLARAAGTFDTGSPTATGHWREQYTFTATSTYTVRCAGLNWLSSGDNNLLAAVAFGTVASLVSGDTLNVTWTCSVS